MTSANTSSRVSREDAERLHGAVLDLHHVDGRYLPECRRNGGARCFTFGIYSDHDSAVRTWIEHAAEESGVCWACSQPDDRSNREGCYRCWVMWWSDQRVMPRDIPEPWPGETEEPHDG